MRAIVLAGGKGSRLGIMCRYIPKPLVPVGERPIIDILLAQLVEQGFTHITLAVGHQAALLMAYVLGMDWPVKIDFVHESHPLGTIGPLLQVADLPENFLVVNGDILTDMSFAGLLKRHVGGCTLATVAVCRRVHKVDFGTIEVSDNGRVTGFSEKPKLQYLVSMGAYALSRGVLKYIESSVEYGFDRLIHDLLTDGASIATFEHLGSWLDIGRPTDYERANALYQSPAANRATLP